MSPSSHINYHCQVLPVSILLKILTQLQSNCNEMQLDNRYKSDFPQKSLMFAAPKPSWKYWSASLQSAIKVIPHRSKSLWNGKKIIIIIIKKKIHLLNLSYLMWRDLAQANSLWMFQYSVHRDRLSAFLHIYV